MSKKRSLRRSHATEQLDMSCKETLGGDQEDLQLLQGLNDDREGNTGKEQIEHVEMSEIQDFIEKLGFHKLKSEASEDSESLETKSPQMTGNEKARKNCDATSQKQVRGNKTPQFHELAQEKPKIKKLNKMNENLASQKMFIRNEGSEQPQNSYEMNIKSLAKLKYEQRRKNQEANRTTKLAVAANSDTAVSDQQLGRVGVIDESVRKVKKKKRKKQMKGDEQIRESAVEDKTAGITSRPHLLIKPGIKWFENEFKGDPVEMSKADGATLQELEKLAAKLLEKDTARYNEGSHTGMKASEFQWMKTVMSVGTLSDKIASYIVTVQKSPVHKLATLRTLVGMVDIKGRRQCIMALNILQDLFLSDLLVPGHKLRKFKQHPFHLLDDLCKGNQIHRDRRLALWYFEDQLKKIYASFIQNIDKVAHDTITATKTRAMAAIFKLLADNPEQEQVLLSMLVNKLGAPDRDTVSKAMYQLNQVLQQHPNMKYVVMLEVERLLFRPNISPKAQYYGMCFLNQLLFSWDDTGLAEKLISTYFSFFKACVKKGEVDSKMMSALLTGINRAYPYAKLEVGKLQEQINTLYKILHMVSFNISIQALQMLYLVTDSTDSLSDRFYSALYRQLLDPQLIHSSHQAMFLNLVYKALKKETYVARLKAFIKRLLQVCKYHPCNLICGILVLISEVVRKNPGIISVKVLAAVASNDDDDEEHYEDADKLEAVVKSEEEMSEGDDFLEDSHNSDVLEIKSVERLPDDKKVLDSDTSCTASWVHRYNLYGNVADKYRYDPRCRNPLFSGAENSITWELEKLRHHYHPTVALYAETLLSGKYINYSGDPLENFTIKRFLDRFVLRNPKKEVNKEKPNAVLSRKLYLPTGLKAVTVDDEKFLNEDEENIPVEDLFFYKFYRQRADKLHTVIKKEEEEEVEEAEGSDADSVTSEEFHDFMKHWGGFGKEVQDMAVDFATEVQTQKRDRKKKGKKGKSDEPEESDDGGEAEEEEPVFSGDEDLEEKFEEYDGVEASSTVKFHDLDMGNDAGSELSFDEEEVAFSDNDDMNERTLKKTTAGKKRKPGGDRGMKASDQKKQKKSGVRDVSDLFASAEEFAHLIEENASSGVDTVGLHALANKDNAGEKQLQWEISREKWIQGAKHTSYKKTRPTGNRKIGPYGNRKMGPPSNRKMGRSGNRKMGPPVRGKGMGKPAFANKGKKNFSQQKAGRKMPLHRK